jgi:hydroxymethylbilane synthase
VFNKKIIIGSRGSELALWQANHIKDRLSQAGFNCSITIIKTQGDKIQHLSFDKLEGKGFFTKELEEALLAGTIDLAVHSHKDLPTTSPKKLCIAAVSEREDPSEILLISKSAVDEKQAWNLKKNAQVGTSSARRKTQLFAYRNDLKISDLRGNVPTRIQKLRDGQYDAIMLAAAGVERLQINLDEFIVEKLDPKVFVPAPAQGVLALQTRENDVELIEALQVIHQKEVANKINVERKVLNLFDGGCQLPLGVYCEKGFDEEENAIFKVWVSKASEANKAPIYTYYEKPETTEFAHEIVAHLNAIKPCRVFVTRNLQAHHLFSSSLTAQGFEVNGISLITFNTIAIKNMPQTDWIFFSSKHAVENFFKQQPNVANQKLGAIGKSTADAIRKFGKRAEFIGQSTDTKTIGKQFAARVGSATVLFPIAKGSLRSVQSQFVKKEQTFDINVYETIEHSQIKIPQADILIFTSPSNVNAYLKDNKVETHHKVIAMGGATEAELRKHGVRKCTLPKSFDDLGILQAVYKIAVN